MVKPEWGAKRQCPKCGTRFYDLGNDSPITCIGCGHTFQHEPILKSRRPREEAEEAAPAKKKAAPPAEAAEDDSLDDDVADDDADEVISLDEAAEDEDEDVSGVISPQVDETET